DRITARLPQLSAWQAAWNQAADDLNDTSIVEIYPEDIGRLAFALLAVQHPDRCHTAADYDGWTPGGAA
ncbi:hypothetical protein KBZ21_40995, partial [Streptomyces sp. A73]|nr:hypothetical protein [Streptomyces sp. A73]